MAGSRTERSTIAEGRDPLNQVTYTQKPPIEGLIADTSEEAKENAASDAQADPVIEDDPDLASEPVKGKVTVVVPADLLERLRNAAWWKRKTLATLAEDGIRQVVERLERQNGGPFKPREDKLKTGRPPSSNNVANRSR